MKKAYKMPTPNRPINLKVDETIHKFEDGRLIRNDAPLMTIKEAAEYLQFSYETIRRFSKAGKLPGILIGCQWRFKKDALDRWLDQRAVR